MAAKVDLETTSLLQRMPSLAARILSRFLSIAAMVGAWSGAMALHLEGVWLVFAPLVVMFGSLFLLARLQEWLAHVAITLGTDGIYVEQVFRHQFVPFAEVEKVSLGVSGSLILTTRGAGPLVFHAARSRSGGERLDGLVEKIEDARVASLASPDDSPVLLERGERTIGQWISELRALSKGETYRDASVDPIRLWSMVESPSAEPSHRAAAAVALRDQLDDAGKTRLRVAADACASPHVRVALEAAAEEDDEKLSLALERL
jgi:hypothetical protein